MYISLVAVVRIIVMFIREDHVVHHISYLDHTWKTTLAGEYAPPAILDQKV